MGEKETASAEELERQQGPRTAQQGFRTAVVDAQPPTVEAAKTYDVKTNEKGEAREAGDLDGDGPPEAAINNTKSNLKSQPGGGSSGGAAQQQSMTGDLDADAEEAAINNSKSNIKNLREGDVMAQDDWDQTAKAAQEKPVKSEIAIGDPGVNSNLEVEGGGAAAERASLQSPRAGYDIKTNTK